MSEDRHRVWADKSKNHGGNMLVKVIYLLRGAENPEFTDKNRQVATHGSKRQLNGKEKEMLLKNGWFGFHLIFLLLDRG